MLFNTPCGVEEYWDSADFDVEYRIMNVMNLWMIFMIRCLLFCGAVALIDLALVPTLIV